MLNKITITLWFLVSIPLNTAFAQFDLSHEKFNGLLKNYVVESENFLSTKVKYKLFDKDKQILEEYLDEVSRVGRDEYSKWEKDDRLAFLINAYNAFTIKLVLDNYGEIDSIKDIGSLFSNAWKIKFFKLFGEKTNLDTIEHGMIRKQFSEPLIHGALVCAAKSCPPLRKEAYRGDILPSQLIDNMQRFLKDREKNRYNNKNNHVELSSIFKWYKKDFTKVFGRYSSVNNFIIMFSEYLSDDKDTDDKLKSGEFGIKYNDYDWSLNE
jgi:Protein of unknown function, DUF547